MSRSAAVWRRAIGIAAASALAGAILVGGIPAAAATPPAPACGARLLVLSAFPAELDALIAHAQLDPAQTVVVDGRSFYAGTLGGNRVVMALTGIGPVNAQRTTQTAVDHFRCGSAPGFSAAVFSGVAGGRTNIGDVAVPRRWTLDGGRTWIPVDPAMLATARQVATGGSVHLERDAPVGDPSCACQDLGPLVPATRLAPVHMPNQPTIIVGGNGVTTDPVGGRALPCVPAGGDIFGCEPCRAPSHATPDPGRVAAGAVPFADPNFFLGEFQSPPATTTSVDASDEETAAVDRVVTRSGIPFLGFRGVSDGQGDPLKLPGFPFQFFYYRQLAADNAAAVALRFLEVWAVHSGTPAAAPSAASAGAAASKPGAATATVSGLPDTAGPGGPPLGVTGLALAGLGLALARARRRRLGDAGSR